ncbi:hypothetical protein GCM10010306_091820 [Streptomyces umbrinus]|nr:hypothetical protein GCM10010306_091820 [Streptomyces umbrinus]
MCGFEEFGDAGQDLQLFRPCGGWVEGGADRDAVQWEGRGEQAGLARCGVAAVQDSMGLFSRS